MQLEFFFNVDISCKIVGTEQAALSLEAREVISEVIVKNLKKISQFSFEYLQLLLLESKEGA
jgi:hypothetical protein